jgi:cytoskeleton protein RodZ
MDIGAQLRSAREALGVSLALIAQKTRVQPRIIAAIEHNDLASIPPRPFGRGFIRAYAREVGLDPDVIVQAYFAQFGTAATPAPAANVHASIDAASSTWPHRVSWVVPAALVGLAGLLALAISRGGIESDARVAAGPTAAAQSVPTTPPPAPVGTTGSPTTPASDLTMKIVADRECWVRASADGKRELYQLLKPGAEHTLRAEHEIAIRVGDAGALRVGLNGKTPEKFGADGAIRSARFTPESADSRAPQTQPIR